MKVKTYTHHIIELDDGTELEVDTRPEDYAAVEPTFCLSSADPTKAVLVYTVYDDDCSNPLEDCDGMGHIYHHPRSDYGRRGEGSDYYEALGLDSHGDPVVDNYEREIGPSPYAVLLDVYEHSMRSYSVSGHGMQCRWDTSRGEAVWMPDKCAKEEIDRRAEVYQWGEVVERGYKTKTRYAAIADCPAGMELGEFEHWHEAFAALQEHCKSFVAEDADEQLAKGIERATLEFATSCVEEYDAWQSGDCHTLVACYYTKTADGWELADTDYCGGFVGREYAAEGVWEHVPPEYQRPAV